MNMSTIRLSISKREDLFENFNSEKNTSHLSFSLRSHLTQDSPPSCVGLHFRAHHVNGTLLMSPQSHESDLSLVLLLLPCSGLCCGASRGD